MKQRYNPAEYEVCSKQPKWAADFGGKYMLFLICTLRTLYQVSDLMFISSPKKFGKFVVQSQLHLMSNGVSNSS